MPELELDRLGDDARPRGPGEEDGRDYWFLTAEEFLARIEPATSSSTSSTSRATATGTLRSELERIRGEGPRAAARARDRGRARRVKDEDPGAVTIFISAAVDELERRLRERATESTGEIGERIALARRAARGRPTASTTSSRTTSSSGRVEELTELVRGLLAPAGTMSATMIHPRVDDLLHNVDSRYALVIVAAKRARQINNYHHQLGEGTFDDNPPPLVSPARRTTSRWPWRRSPRAC